MCGRYHLVASVDRLIEEFSVTRSILRLDTFQLRYNIAPGQFVPIIRELDQERELVVAKWGLVPHWSKEPRLKYSTINARAETVAEKPVYRTPFKTRRCIVPATGFYEWKACADHKTPYNIQAQDGHTLAFAGLWDHWGTCLENAFDSFSIIVTAANESITPIHDRMPVILSAVDYSAWLDPSNTDTNRLGALLAPYSEKLATIPVSRYVNSPSNDDPKCLGAGDRPDMP